MSSRQIERRKIKKEIALNKNFLKILPILQDCSEVYGDNIYTGNDYGFINAKIIQLEKKLSEI